MVNVIWIGKRRWVLKLSKDRPMEGDPDIVSVTQHMEGKPLSIEIYCFFFSFFFMERDPTTLTQLGLCRVERKSP